MKTLEQFKIGAFILVICFGHISSAQGLFKSQPVTEPINDRIEFVNSYQEAINSRAIFWNVPLDVLKTVLATNLQGYNPGVISASYISKYEKFATSNSDGTVYCSKNSRAFEAAAIALKQINANSESDYLQKIFCSTCDLFDKAKEAEDIYKSISSNPVAIVKSSESEMVQQGPSIVKETELDIAESEEEAAVKNISQKEAVADETKIEAPAKVEAERINQVESESDRRKKEDTKEISNFRASRLEKFRSNVVHIENLSAKGKVGFGFITGEDKEYVYITTAGHIVEESTDSMMIRFFDEKDRTYKGNVLINYSQNVDLAILRCRRPQINSWIKKCQSSSYPKKGKEVGYIGKNGDWDVSQVLGRISEMEMDKSISVELTINAGTSGAPLISKNGNILGMIIESETNPAHAYGIAYIKNVITNNGAKNNDLFQLEEKNKGKIREKIIFGTIAAGGLAWTINGLLKFNDAKSIHDDYETYINEFDFQEKHPDFTDRAEAYQEAEEQRKMGKNRINVGGAVTLVSGGVVLYLFTKSKKNKEKSKFANVDLSPNGIPGITLNYNF